MLATHDNHAITCVRGHVWVWFVTSLDVSNSLVPNLTTNACNLGWVSTIIWFIEVDVFSIWCQNAHGTYDVGMYFLIKLIIKREGRRRRGKKKKKGKKVVSDNFFFFFISETSNYGRWYVLPVCNPYHNQIDRLCYWRWKIWALKWERNERCNTNSFHM